MVFKLDWNGKILEWFGKRGNNPDSNTLERPINSPYPEI